jgi:energy-coupling factor transporter ATP-binding protein EcfA2
VTYSYRTYGLYLTCDSPIPGLNEEVDGSRRADVHVELSAQPAWAREALPLPSEVLQSIAASPETQDPAFVLTSLGDGNYFQLAYSDGTRFLVNGETTRIWGLAGECQTIQDLSTYLLGPVMGFILRHRGVTALHASAVCFEGKAIALTGAAGAGKSTTAAALAMLGLPVLCEDIAAVDENDGNFAIHAGYPRVCLWPESVAMLMGRRDALPHIAPNWDKCYLQLDGVKAKLETLKQPLGAVYILAPRETENAPRIEEVSCREVLLELVQNTYMNWLLDRRQRAEEFALLSRLVSQVPVRRIVPHGDPSRIGELCELIVADATALLAGQARMGAAAGR